MRRIRPFERSWARARSAISSLWFSPILALILAIALARFLTFVDRNFVEQRTAWYLFGGSAESAQEILGAIANSLITFTGVVFSITIVVLQLASSQFSPRVLPAFLKDRFTRLALGVFVGSFIYAMAVLSEVRTEAESGRPFVPSLATFVAFLLVVASVATFVRYLHNMANAIRLVQIVARVASETRSAIERLMPDPCRDDGGAPALPPRPADDPARVICNADAGVVAAVEEQALVTLAERHQWRIDLLVKAGDFVPRQAPLLSLWGGGDIDEEQLRSMVLIIEERTPDQDPAFGFRQLVDIAERALSPSTNDPTSAVQALDQLHDLLRCLAGRQFPPGHRTGHDGALRLVVPRTSWDDYVQLAFDEIRHYGQDTPPVRRRLQAAMEDLLTVAPAGRQPALRRQLQLLLGNAARPAIALDRRR